MAAPTPAAQAQHAAHSAPPPAPGYAAAAFPQHTPGADPAQTLQYWVQDFFASNEREAGTWRTTLTSAAQSDVDHTIGPALFDAGGPLYGGGAIQLFYLPAGRGPLPSDTSSTASRTAFVDVAAADGDTVHLQVSAEMGNGADCYIKRLTVTTEHASPAVDGGWSLKWVGGQIIDTGDITGPGNGSP
jgi:hypothetical protein